MTRYSTIAASRSKARKAHLSVETLEKRDLMAGITFNALTGVVSIYGSNQDDVANVSVVGSDVKVNLTCYADVEPYLSFFNDAKTYAVGDVKEVKFYGYDGKDEFNNNTSIKSYADGGLGNDELNGGSGADFFVGNYGNDTLNGNGGNDTLWGSGGHDQINGGIGHDLLKGHGGCDTIYGGSGNDSIYGGSQNDRIFGEGGNDTIVTIGGGTDTITGGYQWDNVWMDTTDVMTDASANELSLGYIHKINQFWSYSYDGGASSTPVSKELSGQNLADPNAYDGQLWGGNFKDHSLFASGGPTKNDVFQGGVGDCYFLSRLAAMAKANPESIKKMVVDLGDGTYAVRFFRYGTAEYVRVDGDLYTTMPGGDFPVYGGLGQNGCVWSAIVEKAYAFWRKQQGSYPSINGGNGGYQHVSQDLLGGAVNPTIKINDGVTAQQVIDWFNAGSPNGTLKNKITTGVVSWLNAVKDALDAGKAVVVSHKYGVHNNMAIVDGNWRTGQHLTTVDAVLTDGSGNPIGIRLRDQYGETNGNGYNNGYIEITDFTRIYFVLGSAAAMTV